jgi:hypothetical protein
MQAVVLMALSTCLHASYDILHIGVAELAFG